MRRTAGSVASCALAVVALGACSAGDTGGGTAGPLPSSGTADVLTIKNFTFSDGLTVKPGATVTVENLDNSAHDVVRKGTGAWNTGHIGKNRTMTFTAPATDGSYDFHCAIHNYMTGTLTVAG